MESASEADEQPLKVILVTASSAFLVTLTTVKVEPALPSVPAVWVVNKLD